MMDSCLILRVLCVLCVCMSVCVCKMEMDGRIQSPQYPKPYPADLHKQWDLEVPPGYQIQLTFNHLDVKPSPYCYYDHLLVLHDQKLLGKFCGQDYSDPHHPGNKSILSPSNRLKLVFVTDESNPGIHQHLGFSVFFQAVDTDECLAPSLSDSDSRCSQICLNTLGSYLCACYYGYQLQPDRHTCILDCIGGHFTELKGSLSSPGYPKRAPYNMNCNYTINVQPGFHITLNFNQTFHIMQIQQPICIFHWLQISVPGEAPKRFCGDNSPGVINTHSHSVELFFHTDGAGESRGFSLTYTTNRVECNLQNITNGKITPDFPKYFYRDYIHVRCDTGYKLMMGDKEIKTFRTMCQEDGTWHPPLPQCEIIDCGKPKSLLTSGLRNVYGSIIQYHCKEPTSKLNQAAQELTERDWEQLGSEVISLNWLRGLSDRLTLDQDREPWHHHYHNFIQHFPVYHQMFNWKVQGNITESIHIQRSRLKLLFRGFLKDLERRKTHRILLSASELSYSYTHKLIVILDNEAETLKKADEEYSADPHNSTKVNLTCLNLDSCPPVTDRGTVIRIIGSHSENGDVISGFSGSALSSLMFSSLSQTTFLFSFFGNITSTFRNHFVGFFRSHDLNIILETTDQTDHVYQTLDETGTLVQYRAPKRPVDHSTRYDWQHILIMQDDRVVREAATALFEKHPTVTSVYMLENQKPKLIKGDPMPLSADSRLALVGHGGRGPDEVMRLAGYDAKQVAEIIKHMNIEEGQLKTVSVVACEVGSDKTFRETLFSELHAASIETELHLRSTLVKVDQAGQKKTAEITLNGIIWAHNDGSKKVVLKRGRNGETVTQIKSESSMGEIYTGERNFLTPFQDLWPQNPEKFVAEDSRQPHTDNLEAISYALFQHRYKTQLDKPHQLNLRPSRNNNVKYILYKIKNHKVNGRYSKNPEYESITSEDDINNALKDCYEIKSGEDILNIIAHFASFPKQVDTYLMLNDWIYSIDAESLYVFPLGKRLKQNEDPKTIEKCITDQFGKHSYPDIKYGIGKSKGVYTQFAKESLQGTYKNNNLEPEIEAWLTTYFLATVISESSRNFRSFPVTLMALDISLSQNPETAKKGLEFLFNKYPMARAGSWINSKKRGFYGASHHGLMRKRKMNLKDLTKMEEDIVTKWLQVKGKEEMDVEMLNNLLSLMYHEDKLNTDDSIFKTFQKSYEQFLDEIVKPNIGELKGETEKSNTGLTEESLSDALHGSYDGPVSLQDVHLALEVENSLKISSYYSRSSASLSEHISDELKRTFGERLEELTVNPDSVRIQVGEFHCQFSSDKTPSEIIEWKVTVPREAQYKMEKIQKTMERVSEGMHERAGLAVGIAGVILGAQGAIKAFEQKDTKHAIMGTAQTIHGVLSMSLAALGKQINGGAKNRMIKVISKVFRSSTGKMVLRALPVVGIGFAVYNIEEDLMRNDTLGDIDAFFDTLILALDNVGEEIPVVVPFNIALSAVRMAFDDIFVDVQYELKKLPPNASTLDKVEAVSKGIGWFALKMFLWLLTIDYPLDKTKEGMRLVEQISDYHKYYTTIEDQSGRKTIDFTGGQSSWNGGNITFSLSDQGLSKFCMDYFVSHDKRIGRKCWDIQTDGTTDIILGTGESHNLTYSSQQICILFFIPVYSIKVVSGYQPLNFSRYGTYSGNNKANSFFAVQNSSDHHQMEIMLSYFYRLYGKEGDDTFFLGPQRSYVEGQGGKDIYIIPEHGGNTNINNYDPLKKGDWLIFKVNFDQMSVSKSGNDVILQYYNNHYVRLINWFRGEQYRHLTALSADGVVIDISTSAISSVKLIAQAVNLMSKSEGRTVDTTEPHLLTVRNIVGSPHQDRLIGNGQNNMIYGGGGQDYMKGGEGEDVYVVNNKTGSKVRIENYSEDKYMDRIIIDANLHDFRTIVQGNNLILRPFKDQPRSDITLINWFSSEDHRHLQVLTKDLIVFSLSANKSRCREPDPVQSKCILSQVIDYSQSKYHLDVDLKNDQDLQTVTDVHGSDLDDKIRGNSQANTIIPLKGADFLEGREGQDIYVITPGHGIKVIDNYSPDMAIDILYLKECYSFISAQCFDEHLGLFVNGTLAVRLRNWFNSKKSQHLLVRSSDVVIFKLESDPRKCRGHLISPQTVDYRNAKPFHEMVVKVHPFVSVLEMYGSPGYDLMVGNANDNLLDPFTGGAFMAGGDGKDTYIIKPEYGTQLTISNFAEDEKEDTVLFQAEFLCSPFTVHAENSNVILSASEKGRRMMVRLQDYRNGPEYQHLSFQSADGVHFRIRSPIRNQSEGVQDVWIEAYKVILQSKQFECHLDLRSQGNLSTVYTVQGCPYQSNHLQGNDLDNSLFGGLMNDVIDGGEGHDMLIGVQGNDILLGSYGDDTLYGGDGDDTMIGGLGNDVFIPGAGVDMVDGGLGRDTVIYQGDHQKGEGVYINLLTGENHLADAEGDVLKDVENVIGTIYMDILVSGYEPTLLKGSDGHDVLVSVAEGDYLIGGEGHDVYLMVPHHGWITIDNCAEDNKIDILYLPSVSQSPDFNDSESLAGLQLKFHNNDGTFLGVFLKDLKKNNQQCGHLALITSADVFQF